MKKSLKIIVILLILLLFACNIFDTRNPAEPQDQAPWNSYFTTIGLSLENLQDAFKYKQNVHKYQQLFSTEYRFYFDDQDISELGITGSTYDKNDESNMLINLYNRLDKSSSIDLAIEPIVNQSDQIMADYAYVYRTYSLSINNPPSGFASNYQGKLELYFEKDSSDLWKIKHWKDFRTNNTNTFGRLKHVFFN